MRILADENVPRVVVTALREAGHDVSWIRTEAPGAPDADVIARARDEDRLLVSFDKDFGELAFRSGSWPAGGVILLRCSPAPPARLAAFIVRALASRDDWSGRFSVVEDDRLRVRPLPGRREPETP